MTVSVRQESILEIALKKLLGNSSPSMAAFITQQNPERCGS